MRDAAKPGVRRRPAAWRPVLALVGPFLVPMGFIIGYCGPNLPRVLRDSGRAQLSLATSQEGRAEYGPDGRRTFNPYDLGEGITDLIDANCDKPPPFLSLDFWSNPDAYDRIALAHRPSPGASANLRDLLRPPGDPRRVDLAFVQDGWSVDGVAGEEQIRSLARLYKAMFFAFARKDGPCRPLRTLGELAGLPAPPRVYLGADGSATRDLAERLLKAHGVAYVAVDDPRWDDSIDAAAQEIAQGRGLGAGVDVAFVLAKFDSGVVRHYACGGRHHLLSVSGDEPALARYDALQPARILRGALGGRGEFPDSDVDTVANEIVLACRADLGEAHAFQLARQLSEHADVLARGSRPAATEAAAHPLAATTEDFRFPLHRGARHFLRQGGKVDAFPYAALVVGMGASVAFFYYYHGLLMKWRTDRLIAAADAILARPDAASRVAPLAELGERALIAYKDTLINKEGYDRVKEYLASRRPLPASPASVPPSPHASHAPEKSLA